MSAPSNRDAEYLSRRAQDSSGLHYRTSLKSTIPAAVAPPAIAAPELEAAEPMLLTERRSNTPPPVAPSEIGDEDLLDALDEPTLLLRDEDLEEDLEAYVEDVPDEMVDFGRIAAQTLTGYAAPEPIDVEPHTIPKLNLAPTPSLATLAPRNDEPKSSALKSVALMFIGAAVAGGAFFAGRALGGEAIMADQPEPAAAAHAEMPSRVTPPSPLSPFSDPEMGIDSPIEARPAAAAPTPSLDTLARHAEALEAPTLAATLPTAMMPTSPLTSPTMRDEAPAPIVARTEPSEADRLAAPEPTEQRTERADRSDRSERRERSRASAPTATNEVPSRVEVLTAMTAVRNAVRNCATRRGGVATVRVTVASSGHVTTAVVGGQYQGTSEGSCIARAVRAAHFPEFQRSQFVFDYPFQL